MQCSSCASILCFFFLNTSVINCGREVAGRWILDGWTGRQAAELLNPDDAAGGSCAGVVFLLQSPKDRNASPKEWKKVVKITTARAIRESGAGRRFTDQDLPFPPFFRAHLPGKCTGTVTLLVPSLTVRLCPVATLRRVVGERVRGSKRTTHEQEEEGAEPNPATATLSATSHMTGMTPVERASPGQKELACSSVARMPARSRGFITNRPAKVKV